MKKLLFITISIIAITLGFNYENVFADSVQSYEFTVTGEQQNSLILYDKNGSNPYDFTPKFISLKTTSTQQCGYFATSNFRIYSDITTSNQIVNLKLLLQCDVDSYYFDVENWTQYSSFTGFSIPAGDFKTYTTYTITVYSDNPTSGTPDCPACPEPLDPNRSPVMDDFHNVFINTMLSVIPITAIIFVVWFFIDMLSSLVFGRGK